MHGRHPSVHFHAAYTGCVTCMLWPLTVLLSSHTTLDCPGRHPFSDGPLFFHFSSTKSQHHECWNLPEGQSKHYRRTDHDRSRLYAQLYQCGWLRGFSRHLIMLPHFLTTNSSPPLLNTVRRCSPVMHLDLCWPRIGLTLYTNVDDTRHFWDIMALKSVCFLLNVD